MKNLLFFFLLIFFFNCKTTEKEHISITNSTSSFSEFICQPNPNGWSVPGEYISIDGNGTDIIPALDTPQYILVSDVDFLQNKEFVIGIKIGNTYKALPHRIMDKHEIVNESFGNPFSPNDNNQYSITFCPLAGSAIGFQSDVFFDSISFGVSGEIYNSNLVMYDKSSNTLWSQILQQGINGLYSCEKLTTFHIIETTWENWKNMYPESFVLDKQDGFNRNYDIAPLSLTVNDNSSLFYDIHPLDSRRPLYDRAHGIIKNNFAKAYPISEFTNDIQVIEETIPEDIIIAGSASRNFAVSFFKKLEDGTVLDFEPVQNSGSIILKDTQEGNLWNIWGEAVEGNRTGQQLKPTPSFIAYWFALGAFFPEIEIFDFDEEDG